MALVVNTNTASLNAINNLNRTQRNLTTSFQNISSGLRVSKAADDAAGLGVAESLEAQSVSGRQAMRNTNDGVSIIQVAESAMEEVGDILVRMRELAIQSGSGTLAETERSFIQTEFIELSEEVDRIAVATEFNGTALADGSISTLNVQVGTMDTTADRIQISLGDLSAATLGVDTGSLSLASETNAINALSIIDTALNSVNSYRAGLGAVQNRLDSALRNMESYVENLEAAESRIRDADFAYETAELSKNQIMQQAGIAVLSQAKNINQGVMNLLS